MCIDEFQCGTKKCTDRSCRVISHKGSCECDSAATGGDGKNDKISIYCSLRSKPHSVYYRGSVKEWGWRLDTALLAIIIYFS